MLHIKFHSNICLNIHIKYLVLATTPQPITAIFGSDQDGSGLLGHPVIIMSTINNVVANQLYDIQVSLMLTDLDWSGEYADITFTHSGSTNVVIGRCDGGNTCHGCCDWYVCQGLTSQISSSTASIDVKFEYSSSVSSGSWAHCTDSSSDKSGAGVARVVLTPAG